ncbi:MAG TPA: ABC transporter permease [Gemmatimonadaceae bacterium]|jgi:ABC-2 type transport system permease protein|nr:ABC transporter permease [Gemmatimonadaceae bacterium]
MRALRFLLRKEFTQIFRDRVILGMLFVMPMLQLLLLANAATFEVRSARLYVVDHDVSALSRGVVSRLAASGRFVPTAGSPSPARADEAMLDREADVILTLPTGFERDLVRDGRATVQLVVDAEDGAAAALMQSYVGQILASYSRELGAEVHPTMATIGTGAERPPQPGRAVIDVRQRGWYNPTLEYRDFMIPGILVVLVTIIGTLLTAMNIVREKEAGTLDQLNVTPVSRSTFVAAKLIPLWSLALLELALGLVVARLVFDIPIEGSLALVFLAAAIYLLGALGIGLWVSTVAETQQQAMFVSYAIMLVYLLMSGLFTPVRAMPAWAQWVAQASPVMHFTQLMRAVLLKGAGPADVAHELAMLTVIGAAVLTLAVRRYRKRAA